MEFCEQVCSTDVVCYPYLCGEKGILVGHTVGPGFGPKWVREGLYVTGKANIFMDWFEDAIPKSAPVIPNVCR